MSEHAVGPCKVLVKGSLQFQSTHCLDDACESSPGPPGGWSRRGSTWDKCHSGDYSTQECSGPSKRRPATKTQVGQSPMSSPVPRENSQKEAPVNKGRKRAKWLWWTEPDPGAKWGAVATGAREAGETTAPCPEPRASSPQASGGVGPTCRPTAQSEPRAPLTSSLFIQANSPNDTSITPENSAPSNTGIWSYPPGSINRDGQFRTAELTQNAGWSQASPISEWGIQLPRFQLPLCCPDAIWGSP